MSKIIIIDGIPTECFTAKEVKKMVSRHIKREKEDLRKRFAELKKQNETTLL